MNEATQQTPEQLTPDMVMLQMITGFWVARAIYVAADLGVADLLRERPKTAEELAGETETHAASLYRLLRALAGPGIFTEDADGRFALTPLGETLRTDVPGSLRYFAMAELGGDHYEAWGNLMHSVRTGDIAFDHHFGMPVWEFYARNPENARVFNNAMSGMTTALEGAVMQSYDFSPINHLVDVGGGHGNFIATILKANPHMRGTLFDAPPVAEGARGNLVEQGVADRCQVVGGDFFESVAAGGDAYLMKWIIHDWDDERAVAILKNCRRAIRDGGRLLLVELVLPPGDEPSIGKLMDLNMLVMTGGRERTEAEYAALFEAAGFRLTRVVTTPSPMCVIEAVPI